MKSEGCLCRRYLIIAEVTLYSGRAVEIWLSSDSCWRCSASQRLRSNICFLANLQRGKLMKCLQSPPAPRVGCGWSAEWGVEGMERELRWGRLHRWRSGLRWLLGRLALELSTGCWGQLCILVPLPWFSLHGPGRGQEQRLGHKLGTVQVIEVRDLGGMDKDWGIQKVAGVIRYLHLVSEGLCLVKGWAFSITAATLLQYGGQMCNREIRLQISRNGSSFARWIFLLD